MLATFADPGDARAEARVSALYHYPIKSCGGTRVESIEVVATGPVHDRELMVADAQTGRFLTQRDNPHMALIAPAIRDGRLYATAPRMSPLEAEVVKNGTPLSITIWKDRVESIDQGDEVATWFSSFLRRGVRVVRKAAGVVRAVDPTYATSTTDQVGFADGYPFLLLSDESLADLNRRLAEPLPMDRFRPNIVIAGCAIPYHEDTLDRFAIGGIGFSAVKLCARCKITTVDQRTAQLGKEPLRTLATYRRSPNGGVMFGMNLIHHCTGRLTVGECVVLPAQ
jgi:uncharacterized protein YcbX